MNTSEGEYAVIFVARTMMSTEMSRANGRNRLFLGGGGHDVAGLGGKAGAFELDGDVVDGERVVEFLADGGEDGFTFVHVHVGDAGVAAHGVVVAAEGPDVNVVNFVDAGDGEDGTSNLFHLQVLRTAFEQDVGGVTQNADAGPQNKEADGEAEDRVNPTEAGVMNGDGA